jgi:hypothetical protein
MLSAYMARPLLAGLSLLLFVVLTGLACTAPPPQPLNSPEAQATNVRRTAVAQVQAIIANKSTPTPPPEPTPTPKPTCPSAIWWSEARNHAGETHTIQGTVVAARAAPGGGTLVEVGQPYPDPTGLAILVESGSPADMTGKTICVAGRISLDEGRPTLQVRDPTAFRVVD